MGDLEGSGPEATGFSGDLEREQYIREATQRDVAFGRRFKAASEGLLGPVISRWINASVGPVAARLRLAAEVYCIERDYPRFASILDSPLFGLAATYEGGSSEYLEPILKWCLSGVSQGRSSGTTDGSTTHCEDLVLAGLGSIISALALRTVQHKVGTDSPVEGVTLAMALSDAARAMRETALGQFIVKAQGVEALEKVRTGLTGKFSTSWGQLKVLNEAGRLLNTQIKHQLDAEARGEATLEHVGSRTIVTTRDIAKDKTWRRSIKAGNLTEDDWKLLSLAITPKGEQDSARPGWLSAAMLVLICAQIEHGWFDLVDAHTLKHKRGRRPKGRTRYLILSERPKRHLKSDLERWVEMGFVNAPMVVPPRLPEGGYLSVHHRPVTGRNGPYGARTDAMGTTAWETAVEVMAGTPWQISRETLHAVRETTDEIAEIAKAAVPDNAVRAMLLGAHAKEARQEALYLPLYMDFRGRLYPRTTWISYQGNDLQKGLLRFTPGDKRAGEAHEQDALVRHISGLWGLDKCSMEDRRKWFFGGFNSIRGCPPQAEPLEDPVQAWTAKHLWDNGEWDSIPCQIDGTCNGLQHLSALFRDHDAAPLVNLLGGGSVPGDLYGEVARRVGDAMVVESCGATPETFPPGKFWIKRLGLAGAKIDRKVCKRPVMVLPYGGTMVAVEEAIFEALLEQGLKDRPYKEDRWMTLEERTGNYMAFRSRPLRDHPLFRSDVRKLAILVFEQIGRVIPKAMHAMDAFRRIAGQVGQRTLEWSNGVGPNPLWIIHAYPKSARRTGNFRGFHLPNSVRGLAMKCGRDEINPAMHRTGIVANYIHSQDAAHLTQTMIHFRDTGGKTFAANHDCLTTRASEMHLMARAVREAFAGRYRGDPLTHPVRMRDLTSERTWQFDSWYSLARDFGVDFPEKGRWLPEDVLHSEWFFS